MERSRHDLPQPHPLSPLAHAPDRRSRPRGGDRALRRGHRRDLGGVHLRGVDPARERNLPAAGAPESQDLCFLAGGDYRRFLARYAPQVLQPGPIRDTSGRELGQHQGLAGYTIGQRKGLNISAPEPLYVLAIEPVENALIVGTASELGRDVCTVDEMRYVSGRVPTAPFRAEAQIRYRARPVDVMVTPRAARAVRVRFFTPQRDITPGQFLVLYDNDVVLGGGAICTAS